METTVDRYDHAIDEDCVIACEKRDRTCDFIRCGGSANWQAITKGDHDGFNFFQIGSGFGRSQTGCYGIDSHTPRTVFKG